jgi:hypothetical protein
VNSVTAQVNAAGSNTSHTTGTAATDIRSFPDASVSIVVDGKVPVSVTTSTALGGAIASLTMAGRQYITSGGHGSALQYDFHAWQGSSASGNRWGT